MEKMQAASLCLKSFAKINLSLDVLGRRSDGYHEVDTVMQHVDLSDRVEIRWEPAADWSFAVESDQKGIPEDRRNLAWQAAELMAEQPGAAARKGRIRIRLEKRIPVAAGLAGGSGNGGAVLIGLAQLWSLPYSLPELLSLGARLGADVPFCMMGIARGNPLLRPSFRLDPMAAFCARATGTGTELSPVAKGLSSFVLLSRPPLEVSAGEVYKGLGDLSGADRPDTPELLAGIAEGNLQKITKNMKNLLEIYTLKRYPIVMYTKNKMRETEGPARVLMSGSGPCVFGLYESGEKVREAARILRKINPETHETATLP